MRVANTSASQNGHTRKCHDGTSGPCNLCKSRSSKYTYMERLNSEQYTLLCACAIAHVVHVQGDPKKHNMHSSIPDGGKWASVNLRPGVLLKAVETQPLKTLTWHHGKTSRTSDDAPVAILWGALEGSQNANIPFLYILAWYLPSRSQTCTRTHIIHVYGATILGPFSASSRSNLQTNRATDS